MEAQDVYIKANLTLLTDVSISTFQNGGKNSKIMKYISLMIFIIFQTQIFGKNYLNGII